MFKKLLFLNDAEKKDEWKKLANGRAHVGRLCEGRCGQILAGFLWKLNFSLERLILNEHLLWRSICVSEIPTNVLAQILQTTVFLNKPSTWKNIYQFWKEYRNPRPLHSIRSLYRYEKRIVSFVPCNEVIVAQFGPRVTLGVICSRTGDVLSGLGMSYLDGRASGILIDVYKQPVKKAGRLIHIVVVYQVGKTIYMEFVEYDHKLKSMKQVTHLTVKGTDPVQILCHDNIVIVRFSEDIVKLFSFDLTFSLNACRTMEIGDSVHGIYIYDQNLVVSTIRGLHIYNMATGEKLQTLRSMVDIGDVLALHDFLVVRYKKQSSSKIAVLERDASLYRLADMESRFLSGYTGPGTYGPLLPIRDHENRFNLASVEHLQDIVDRPSKLWTIAEYPFATLSPGAKLSLDQETLVLSSVLQSDQLEVVRLFF